jgi:PAS domain-containing protein
MTEFAHRLRTGISKQLSRNEYRTLVEQAPVVIWRLNTNAECDYCNNGWLQFRGRSLERSLDINGLRVFIMRTVGAA